MHDPRDGAADAGRAGNEELLLRVAWFYYKDELTQEEIAQRLALSRASVGRMLDRARKIGMVTINLNVDHLAAFELSARLARTFGLREALVVPDYGDGQTSTAQHNARIALGGAQFLSTHLPTGSSLGVGWGDTASRVIRAINFAAIGAVHMVTLTGGVDGYLQTIMSSRTDAESDTTTATVIPTPIVTSTRSLATALRAEPAIQSVLEAATQVDQAIVGVGTPAEDATIVRMGYLTAEETGALRDRGVVGDILGQFYNANGKVVRLPIHQRRIGIDLAELKAVQRVVAVAGGIHKTEAILGALRGGYIDVLVTDEQVATRLLEPGVA
ncbi:sugar-binding transcriptional regulator [Kribbella solani]|uniref:sugar-binding transcriptional regulator n=1 Tax=Kribbella solani TaxID=236067 RepID=UPI0029A10DD8|nr:sugar-binding transcriptional regulator [Kribbella solani]MDX2970140.1 sugar-binding transcriptional regulator [Kribbella solani]